jgi:chemotaxis protein CheX
VAQLKVELITPFITSTQDTFATMMGIKARRKEVYIKRGFEMYGEYSGVIGLSGATTGSCGLSLPTSFARYAVNRMLMTDDPDSLTDVDLRDGVGEMVNMVAGGAKTLLSSTRYRFNITLPTIISGGRHEVFHRPGTYCVVVLLGADEGETFALEVAVQPE